MLTKKNSLNFIKTAFIAYFSENQCINTKIFVLNTEQQFKRLLKPKKNSKIKSIRLI